MKSIIFAFTLTISFYGYSQNFIELNIVPFNQLHIEDYWTGACWFDYENDGDLDLFLTNRKPGQQPRKNKVLINLGNDNFTPLTEGPLVSDDGFWFGVNLLDYNHDGLQDIYLAGYPGTLYKNLGEGEYKKVKAGAIGEVKSAGIASACADLNLDGYIDIILIRPNWIPAPPFFGTPPSPMIFINSGPPNYRFDLFDNSFMPSDETFLQPTLFDYDNDGDSDIILGMGSGKPKHDLFYKNKFIEEGKLHFQRDTSVIMSKILLEGNHWSFNDIDNDGDFDAIVANWAVNANDKNLPKHNNVFINQNGQFEQYKNDLIVSNSTKSTTISWGDFDNDGDLDAIEVNDSTYNLKYYQNDGKGNFVNINAGDLGLIVKHQSGISIGDYDNDGDLDVFVPGAGRNSSMLKNDLSNDYGWIKIELVGNQSNQMALGAKLFLYTTDEKGNKIVQSREVSGSNTFFGTNAITQHFGLKKNEILYLVINWPSGLNEKFDNLRTMQLNTLHEGTGKIETK